jgi:glycerol-3-phosphate acyltransferase PlsY
VVSCLAPLATLIAGGAFLVTFGIWQYVSLGAIVAAVVFALAQFGKFGATLFSGSRWSLGVFSLLVPTLIILRHRSNIGRLLRGEEPRYGSTKKGEGKDSPPRPPESI